MSPGATARCLPVILATIAAVAAVGTGASASQGESSGHGGVLASTVARHARRRVTLSVYTVGGMPNTSHPGGPVATAAIVVLNGPGGKRRVKVPAHPLVVTLPAGRYNSYALYPRAVGFVLKCYAKGRTFVARDGSSLNYICNVP